MVVIGNIQNPTDTEMSSQFAIQTMFKEVIVEANYNFGRTPFTSTPGNDCNYLSGQRDDDDSQQLRKHFGQPRIVLGLPVHALKVLPNQFDHQVRLPIRVLDLEGAMQHYGSL